MIIQQISNSNPYTTNIGNCIKQLGQSINTLTDDKVNDICICDYIGCTYKEQVFAYSGSDIWKNDKSDFLYRRLISSDTVSIYLQKDGIDLVELTDDSLGTLFDGFPNGNSEQQLYYGYLLDWKLVLAAHGVGNYNIRTELSVLGSELEVYSRDFKLSIFSDLAADGTVKIDTVQNGNILGSEFDYTGIRWNSSIRISGRFGNPTPVYEEDRYLDQTNTYQQVKATMSREWFLNTGLLNSEVAQKLVYNKLLGNEIYITDYSIKAENIWRSIPVKLDEIAKPEIFNYPYKRYNIKFVDNKLIYQKRNY